MAFSVHLAGAAFAFVYYQRGWNLTRLTPGRIPWPSFRRKPRLRIHEPEQEPGSDLSAEVDRILEKIYREGEASLTGKERKTLETASREYQRKKRTKDDGMKDEAERNAESASFVIRPPSFLRHSVFRRPPRRRGTFQLEQFLDHALGVLGDVRQPHQPQ